MSKEIYLKLTVSPPPPLSTPKKVIRIIGFAIVVFCLILLGRPQSLSFGSEEQIQGELQTENPTRVAIQKIAIDLPVKETTINNSDWEINPNGASHLDISADPGTSGNIIIYDHNTWNHFGKITQLKNGDLIEIRTDSGKIFNYKVYKTIVVDPSDVHVLKEYQDQSLTLYTCTGFLDSKRFVVKAERI